MRDDRFFEELRPLTSFREVANLANYTNVPAGWLYVITDVRGSTKAIEAGRYKDVNAIGVASIVALRNAAKDVELPFVFGGDGATLLAPASRRQAMEAALRGVRAMSRDSFDLDLRVAVLPIDELIADGFDLMTARLKVSGDVTIGLLGGEGVGEGERLAKDTEVGPRYAVSEDGPTDADFEGFECRWEPIPSQRGQVMSILVQALAPFPADRLKTYQRVLGVVENLDALGHPVSPGNLRIAGPGAAFDAESRLHGPPGSLGYRLRQLEARFKAGIGRFCTERRLNLPGLFPGKAYKEEVAANTDYRKFDGVLRMVLDVSDDGRRAIEAALATERDAGALAYGIHVAPASLMTCVIGSYFGNHLHFVDGADGGYALAAKQLKAQLKETPAPMSMRSPA